jgi:hypothetical protein
MQVLALSVKVSPAERFPLASDAKLTEAVAVNGNLS